MLGDFEHKVRFENTGPGDDRWLTEGEVTGPLLDRFNAAIDSMEIDGPHSNNDGDGQEDDESDGEEKGTIDLRIIPRLQPNKANVGHRVPHRCRKQRRRGIYLRSMLPAPGRDCS